jgi:hypothetical protein
MDDRSAELSRLHEELQKTDEAFWREFHDTFARWNLGIGPLRISSPATSHQVAIMYLSFNALCFAAGVTFALFGGVWAALGVALVVGSLFSFGAFLAQLWVVMRQRGIEVVDRLYGNREYGDLERLGRMRQDILDRIEKLRDSLPAEGATQHPEPAD